ncbi:AEC family transporter [Kingella negevensis]|uniref:AEC family transporter n=1 Tax=Kingella negevensis TaxID=1522312 RepID=UPI00050A33A1|nr:AEC family transporter [Kingella negevensis]MDK4689379.1 AEC family transporter [Kingella negevensis]WII90477.1 AEC family transporter [Kingella negevensis]
METTYLLASKIAELTLIVLMGATLVKCKLLQSENSYPLSIIALYLISPSVMIHAFQIDYTPEIAQGLWLSLKLAVMFHILLIILGKLFKKLFKLDALEQAATVYSNSGNLIIPLVTAIFGQQWVIYTSGFIIVQTFLFWTHLRLLISGSGKLSWKTILTNINILSMLFGILLFALQIKLPRIVDGTLSTVGSMIGPVAMLIAGMLIGSLPLKSILLSARIYLVAFLRLVLVPLILLGVVKLSGFAQQDTISHTVVLISFLATISPAAATVTQMALVYGQNAQKASAIYGVTTLLCILTMPLVIALYQWII